MLRLSIIFCALFASLTNVPNLQAETQVDATKRVLEEAVAEPNNEAKVRQLIGLLPEITPGSGRYIVEGDMAVAREELPAYLLSLKSPDLANAKSDELIVNLVGGKFDIWKTAEDRKLTYSFDEGSFPTPAGLAFTKEKFRAAADEWVTACPECGITFTERADGALFNIRYSAQDDGTIAMAFFPSSPPTERILYVYKSFLGPDLGVNPTGVLIHEIGHILGYRHEHIVGVPGCAKEGSSWKPLTGYTPKSAMHYLCGGQGSKELALMDSDKRGHRCAYMTGKACPVPN